MRTPRRHATAIAGACLLALTASALSGCEVTYTPEGGMRYVYEPGASPSPTPTIDPVLSEYGRTVPQTLDTINAFRTTKSLGAFTPMNDCQSPYAVATAAGSSLDGLGGSPQHTSVTLVSSTFAAVYTAQSLSVGTLTVYQCERNEATMTSDSPTDLQAADTSTPDE